MGMNDMCNEIEAFILINQLNYYHCSDQEHKYLTSGTQVFHKNRIYVIYHARKCKHRPQHTPHQQGECSLIDFKHMLNGNH